MISTLASHVSWAQTEDRTARTEPARRAFSDSFAKVVDPDGLLDPAERARRAEHLRKAHYVRMALKSAQKRRDKRKLLDAVTRELNAVAGGAEA